MLLGRKIGMTQIYLDDNRQVSVTVVSAEGNNRIMQVKTPETDGYSAVQLAYGTKKPNRIKKPMAGHAKKAGVTPGSFTAEYRLDLNDDKAGGKEFKFSDRPELTLGAEYGVEIFSPGDFVDVTGISKGKGYAGVIKRYNFATQDASHGNSLSHRAPGSIGQNQTPGKVFKNKKMAGHLGVERCTVRNLEIMRVDTERNLLLIKGAVPGCETSDLIIRPVRLGKKKKKAS